MQLNGQAGVYVPPELTEAWFLARTRPVGECRVWTGHSDNGGRDPRCTVGGLKNVNVRRLLWAMLHMRCPAIDCVVVAECGTDRCVCPEHLVEVRRGVLAKGIPKTLVHRARIAATKRASSRLPQSKIMEILSSPLTGAKEAERHGLCKDMINRIRAGRNRRDFSGEHMGMFASLMGLGGLTAPYKSRAKPAARPAGKQEMGHG